MEPLKLPRSTRVVWLSVVAVVLALGGIYYLTSPVAEVAVVRRGTATSAVYGSVRIEPIVIIPVRAQNAGFIQLVEPFASGRAAIGRTVEKGQLFATIADETTARRLKQARADLQAAQERAQLPLPSSELLKVAEDNVQRLERLTSLSNIPTVDFEKAKSEVNRLRGAVETERIERDRNLGMLDDACKKLEAQMKSSEIRAPMDGLLTAIQAIDGDVVAQGSPLFTVASQKNYVRGEVNEEDVGEVKIGMSAMVQVYAFRTRNFTAKVSAILPAADPETQRYTIVLELEKPPENLMAGMTGEMNIITGSRENVLVVPTRALLVDQALVVKKGRVQARTVGVGYRTLDTTEVTSGLQEGERVIVADQDRFHAGEFVKQRTVQAVNPAKKP